MSAKHYYILSAKYKPSFFKFPAMTGPRTREIYQFVRKSWYVQYSLDSELLEKTIFNILGDIFGEIF